VNEERKTKKELIAELAAQRRDIDALRGENADLRQQVAESGDVSPVKRQLAVERIRVEAMAMRSSEDFRKVVAVLWKEIPALGIETTACGIGFVDEENERVVFYGALENPQKHGIAWTSPRMVEFDEDIAIWTWEGNKQNYMDTDSLAALWRKGEVWTNVETSDSFLGRFYEEMGFERLPPIPAVSEWHITNVPFTHGMIGFHEPKFVEDHVVTVQELGQALSLGFLRFLDFQKVDEAQKNLIDELEEELQTAHDLQMGLMPTEPLQIDGLDLTGRCIPANHVGGDFFQYFRQDGKLSICMADVTGHAMEAAIPVVMFSGVLKTEMRHDLPIDALFANLNDTMHDALDRRTYVCFVMGELNTADHSFRIANSGCPYPFHFRALTGEVEELQVDAYPLGVRSETAYTALETALATGDYVVFCSDGIIEAMNADEAIFGFEQTAETIRTGCAEGLSAEALIDRLIGVVQGFAGDTPQGDDMTCVVLRVEE